MQDFKSVSDYFTTLRSKGLIKFHFLQNHDKNHWFSDDFSGKRN